MSTGTTLPPTTTAPTFQIVGLSYVSLYVQRFADAVTFYTDVFGPPGAAADNGRHYGWPWARPG